MPKALRESAMYLHGLKMCWLPSSEFSEVLQDVSFDYNWRLLAHEYTHAYDATKSYIAYLSGYFFPQWLSIPLLLIALSGIIFDGFPWYALIAAAVPLLPWRSPTRARIEARGYKAQMLTYKLTHGHIPSEVIKGTIEDMASPLYYGMCSKKQARAWTLCMASELSDCSKMEEGSNVPFGEIVTSYQARER
jgi:hypothetical protein